MWWFYQKISETDLIVRYSYARESYEPDGELEYNKHAKTVELIKTSETTVNEYEIDKAMRKLFKVVKNGYPETKMIAVG